MVIQNNLIALNALNNLNSNVKNVGRATERLASGLRINRASDDAAGLAISEKMRSQIRGLTQAIRNANDGISLLRIAEGGLNETHAILQRMREIAVQSSNGTYHNELDREAMQLEVNALKTELDRIAKYTEYNTMILLDGSLGGGSSNSNGLGAHFGTRYQSTALNQFISISSSVAGATIDFTTNASGKGGENAFFSADGRNVTINLAAGQAYTDSQINDLIQSAKWTGNDGSTGQLAAPARIEFKSDSGVINAINYATQPTVAGQRKTAEISLMPLMVSNTGGTEGHADQIKFTANQYGSHTTHDGLFSSIKISTMPNTGQGQEWVSIDTPAQRGTAGAEITLHLATGTEYTNQDIENLLRRAGFDYTVEMWNDNKPNGFSTAYFNRTGEVTTSGTASSGNISSGGTNNAPSSPPSISNISVFPWTNINRVTEVEGADGVAAVYRFENAWAILQTYTNPSNVGRNFNFLGLNVNIINRDGFPTFQFSINELATGNTAATFILATFLQDDWIVTFDADDMIITAKNPGEINDVADGNDISNSINDGQGLGKNHTVNGSGGLVLQIGANGVADQRVSVSINDMSASALGIGNVDVSTREAANNSIDVLDKAIGRVSMQRASLGAMQNRLESTIRNLTDYSENLTAAESRIRDADMAQEMIKYTKYTILQQAAMAMLTQAMQMPQGVLQLLQ